MADEALKEDFSTQSISKLNYIFTGNQRDFIRRFNDANINEYFNELFKLDPKFFAAFLRIAIGRNSWCVDNQEFGNKPTVINLIKDDIGLSFFVNQDTNGNISIIRKKSNDTNATLVWGAIKTLEEFTQTLTRSLNEGYTMSLFMEK